MNNYGINMLMVRKENESKFILGTLGSFFGGFISLLSILFLAIGIEINSWGTLDPLAVVGVNSFDSFYLAIPFLIIGTVGLIMGSSSFLLSVLNLRKSLKNND